MNWLNEPPVWREANGRLNVTTGERTDFWCETHYGFVRDTGHFRFEEVAGDFAAEVTLTAAYSTSYDQAGLMIRLNERNWMKTGVEFVNGVCRLSCVVTRDYSDWSLADAAPELVTLRVRRAGSAVHVDWRRGDAPDDEAYTNLRLAYMPLGPAMVGPMCCSPEREGLSVSFSKYRLMM